MQKRHVNSYFNFTKKERNGTVFILFIILLLIAIPVIYPFVFKEKIIAATDIQKELSMLKIKAIDSSKKYYQKNFDRDNYIDFHKSRQENREEASKGIVFNFDPNTLTAEGWKKLGIRDKTIQTIQNFISKGGKFKEAADIKKIWGLHEDDINRLLPNVKIENTDALVKPVSAIFSSNKYESKKTFAPVDINLADTTAFINLPGIGSKLSKRIIMFREKLGGFYSIAQVGETFGLPDSVFQKIKPLLLLDNKELKQININTATLDDLKIHPYIRYQLANAIIQYRTQHGNFITVQDLNKIMLYRCRNI